jgi:L-lactate dehydrogenase complex protein LldE
LRIGLFIPCYIDSFLPEVGIATLELLERLGRHVLSAQSDLLWTADGEYSADMEAEKQVHAAEALQNGLQVQVRT